MKKMFLLVCLITSSLCAFDIDTPRAGGTGEGFTQEGIEERLLQEQREELEKKIEKIIKTLPTPPGSPRAGRSHVLARPSDVVKFEQTLDLIKTCNTTIKTILQSADAYTLKLKKLAQVQSAFNTWTPNIDQPTNFNDLNADQISAWSQSQNSITQILGVLNTPTDIRGKLPTSTPRGVKGSLTFIDKSFIQEQFASMIKTQMAEVMRAAIIQVSNLPLDTAAPQVIAQQIADPQLLIALLEPLFATLQEYDIPITNAITKLQEALDIRTTGMPTPVRTSFDLLFGMKNFNTIYTQTQSLYRSLPATINVNAQPEALLTQIELLTQHIESLQQIPVQDPKTQQNYLLRNVPQHQQVQQLITDIKAYGKRVASIVISQLGTKGSTYLSINPEKNELLARTYEAIVAFWDYKGETVWQKRVILLSQQQQMLRHLALAVDSNTDYQKLIINKDTPNGIGYTSLKERLRDIRIFFALNPTEPEPQPNLPIDAQLGLYQLITQDQIVAVQDFFRNEQALANRIPMPPEKADTREHLERITPPVTINQLYALFDPKVSTYGQYILMSMQGQSFSYFVKVAHAFLTNDPIELNLLFPEKTNIQDQQLKDFIFKMRQPGNFTDRIKLLITLKANAAVATQAELASDEGKTAWGRVKNYFSSMLYGARSWLRGLAKLSAGVGIVAGVTGLIIGSTTTSTAAATGGGGASVAGSIALQAGLFSFTSYLASELFGYVGYKLGAYDPTAFGIVQATPKELSVGEKIKLFFTQSIPNFFKRLGKIIASAFQSSAPGIARIQSKIDAYNAARALFLREILLDPDKSLTPLQIEVAIEQRIAAISSIPDKNLQEQNRSLFETKKNALFKTRRDLIETGNNNLREMIRETFGTGITTDNTLFNTVLTTTVQTTLAQLKTAKNVPQSFKDALSTISSTALSYLELNLQTARNLVEKQSLVETTQESTMALAFIEALTPLEELVWAETFNKVVVDAARLYKKDPKNFSANMQKYYTKITGSTPPSGGFGLTSPTTPTTLAATAAGAATTGVIA